MSASAARGFTTTPDETLDQILEYAKRGWCLFPCVRRRQTPLICSWRDFASCDPNVLRRWAAEHRGCNWGMATGPRSGIFALDVDDRKGGPVSLAALEAEHGPLPVTLTVITGGSGEHHYFRYPVGGVRCSVGKLSKGLDIRGEGGQVIVPPSIHPSGRSYQWLDETRAIVEAPDWLLDLLSQTIKRPQTPLEFATLHDGGRDDGLLRYGGALRRRGADLPELEQKLLEANLRRCQPPLGKQQVLKIARSSTRWEKGGPDPLECAWSEAAGKNYSCDEEKFLGLRRCLQSGRPSQDIALPLRRIAGLMGINWATVSRYRQNAVVRGTLTQTAPYIAHRRAACFRFNESSTQRMQQDGTREVRKGDTSLDPDGPPTQALQTRGGQERTSGLVCTVQHPSLHAPSLHSNFRAPSLHGSGSVVNPTSLRDSPSLHVVSSSPSAFADDEALLAKARARGESLGFKGIFLANFIERELILMRKWTAGRRKLDSH